LGGGHRGAKHVFLKALFSGFEVKNRHFLIVEGLALCSILNQNLIITMAFSCVGKKIILYTALICTT